MNLGACFDRLALSNSPVILRRMTVGGLFLDVKCQARVTQWTPQVHYQIEQAGGIAQGDRHCIISDKEMTRKRWPGPPRRGDMIIILDEGVSTSVLGCDSSDIHSVTTRHDMTLRGGG